MRTRCRTKTVSVRRAAKALLLVALVSCGPGAETPEESAARDPGLAALYNRGKAQLENKSAAEARAAFATATERAPLAASAWRNLARAELLARDTAAANAALGRALELEPEAAATHYLLGLAAAREGQNEAAIAAFEAAIRRDAATPALRYQLANVLQAHGRHEAAEAQLRETIRLDPLHATAHYRLATFALERRDAAEHRARLADFQRLRELFGESSRSPDALEACLYTMAESLPPETAPAGAALPFGLVDATETWAGPELMPRLATVAAVAIVEVDAAGASTLVAVDRDGTAFELGKGAEGFSARELGVAAPGAFALAVGNFADTAPTDFRNDLAVATASGIRLWRAEGGGAFTDVSASAGLASAAPRSLRWVDFEVDGDLDLALATDAGLELWQNNGDGTFQAVTDVVGLTGGPAARDLAVADLDANLVPDLVAAGPDGSVVFENQRTGLYQRRPDPPGPWPAALRVELDDLDNDGHPDAALLAERELRVIAGRGGQGVELAAPAGASFAALSLVDLDNDGWLDLVAGGDEGGNGRLWVWRNQGGGRFAEASAAAGLPALALARVESLAAADLDLDGDTDLLVGTAAGLRLVANEGGNQNRQLKIRLAGRKSNPTALGTRVEVRRGRQWLTRTLRGLPLEIGLGSGEQPLDAVLVVWTNGIVDNEIAVPVAGQVLSIEEKNVAAGSCPFLYVEGPEGFRFVTDVLGNSPLGLSRARGIPLDADPDELVWIGPPQTLAATGGRYRLQVTEEMREVLYLDHARLVAVDHPAGLEVHGTDKLMPAPFHPSEVWGLAEVRTPVAVSSSDGRDRLAAVEREDGTFAPAGPALAPQLRGMTEPLALTLDFGPLAGARSPVLALTGWLQYGDASTNIALSQGAAPVVPPMLEAEGPQGWKPLDVVVGVPAGKPKTLLVDLAGKLPANTRRLRLTTTFEIRWDRIALGEKVAPSRLRRHDLAPIAAKLAFRGFSRLVAAAPGHPTIPRHAEVSQRPPWRTSLEGWATRYGDVLELVTQRDGRLALVNAGDALTLEFPADGLPPIPPGHTRTVFFYSVGWDKDADPNVIDGHTIEPLPVRAADHEWETRYNTRWVPRDLFAREGAGWQLAVGATSQGR